MVQSNEKLYQIMLIYKLIFKTIHINLYIMVHSEDSDQYQIFWREFLKTNDKYINTVAIHSPNILTDGKIFNEISS